MKDRLGRRFRSGDRVLAWTREGPVSGVAHVDEEYGFVVDFDHGVRHSEFTFGTRVSRRPEEVELVRRHGPWWERLAVVLGFFGRGGDDG